MLTDGHWKLTDGHLVSIVSCDFHRNAQMKRTQQTGVSKNRKAPLNPLFTMNVCRVYRVIEGAQHVRDQDNQSFTPH